MVHGYPILNYPGMWECMADLVADGRLIMIEQARGECKDESAQPWLDSCSTMVRKFSHEVNICINQLQKDLTTDKQYLVDPSSDKDMADPFVVALAMAENLKLSGEYHSGQVIVVANEKPAFKTRGKIKIPDVCKRYSIECIQLVDVVKRENWVFQKSVPK